jgi:hypothetical protein
MTAALGNYRLLEPIKAGGAALRRLTETYGVMIWRVESARPDWRG